MKKALLLSSSGYKDTGYLRHAKNLIKDFLSEAYKEEILFVPYAGVLKDFDEYEQKVKDRLKTKSVRSIHHYEDKKSAIKNAKTIIVGGGNSFVLLDALYRFDLVEVLQEALLESGAFYVGWSAGANIAGHSIMTTNDMPIIMPNSFKALGIFPHQINPHFVSGKIPNGGESREERLAEFLEINQNLAVFALPEGSGIKILGGEAEVIGYENIYKFEYKKEIETLNLGTKFKV